MIDIFEAYLLIYVYKVALNYFQSIFWAPIQHFCLLLHYAKCPSHDVQGFYLSSARPGLFLIFFSSRDQQQQLLLQS